MILRNLFRSWKSYIVAYSIFMVRLASIYIIVLIRSMNTLTNAARRLEDNVFDARSPPHDEKVPPLMENANVDQAWTNPPTMTEAELRSFLFQMAQHMTTQAQAATVQAQAMTTQANRVVSPRPHQHVTTMASRLRDFTRINPPAFYGSKFDEDTQEFLDEVYIVLYAMGVISSEKADLASYQLKDVA